MEAGHVNAILDALYEALQVKVKADAVGLGEVELSNEDGGHGAVIFGAVLMGDLDGKMTLILRTPVAIQLATELSGEETQQFDEKAQSVVETAFNDFVEKTTESFSKMELEVELLPLPPLTDTNVLLGVQATDMVVKLPLNCPWGQMDLHVTLNVSKDSEDVASA